MWLLVDPRDRPAEWVDRLTRRLRRKGLEPHFLANHESLQHDLCEHPDLPAGVILDLDSLLDQPADVFASGPLPCRGPLAVLSNRDDWEHRLAAVRLGGRHFFRKPPPVETLAGCFIPPRPSSSDEPYRVLLLCDDEEHSRRILDLLRRSGMEARALDSPSQAFAQMDTLQPDLVLVDPSQDIDSAQEFAEVLSQHPRWNHLEVLRLETAEEGVLLGALVASGGEGLDMLPSRARLHQISQRIARLRGEQARDQQLRLVMLDLENLHRALNQHAMMVVLDPMGRITFANALFCETSGHEVMDLLGRRLDDPRLADERLSADVWDMLAQARPWNGPLRNRRADGTLYWTEVSLVPFKDEWGRVNEILAIHTDISRRMAAEHRVHSMALFAELNPQPLIRFDPQGRILESNRAAQDLLGVDSNDRDGALARLMPELMDRDLSEFIRNNARFHFTVVSGERHFHFMAQGVAQQGMGHLYGTDISALVRISNALVESLGFSDSLVNSSLDMIIGMDRDMRVLRFNPAAESLFGIEESRMRGQSLFALFTDPAQAEAVRSGLARQGRYE
ncbi:MAG: PAS domain S-box protein, partial [Magnetococcus sp. WYHC-3]